MLERFRRFSKSKTGGFVLAGLGVAIFASFAMGDLSSITGGGSGTGGTGLVKVGGREVSDRDVGQAFDGLLSRAREQNPAATGKDLAGQFEPLLDSLVQQMGLVAFADANGLNLSKRLLDAEIAKLPQVRGLDGKFSDAAYQNFLAKERLSDAELRKMLEASVTQRLILTPAAANARLSTGMAAPYASMLMERRQGQLALVPIAAFAAGLNPSDADVAAYYAANKARYTVPERRTLRIARFGPAEIAAASVPTDAEIAAYYSKNQAQYAAKETRTISQAVVPDAKVAQGIADRAKGGASFVAAAAPANLSATDVTVGPQTRAQFTDLAGDKIATTAFAPTLKAGSVIGPVQSDLGWHVIRIDAITGVPGRTLEQAKAEIATRLAAEKKTNALGDLVDKVQNGIDGGESFADVIAKNRLTATETPLLSVTGTSDDPAFKWPPELAGALKSGFELTGQDSPVVETLPGDAGFALVGLGKVIPAAPAPLAQIRDRVVQDWVGQKAMERARVAATAIAAKATAGTPLAQAMAAAGIALPAPRAVDTQRIELAQVPPAAAAAMRMLFTLAQGKSRMVPSPEANGFAIVQVDKIIPGNAMAQPTLVARVQGQFQQGASEEYARQFLNAMIAKVGVKRNEAAIAATRQRLTAGANGQ